MKEQIKGLIEYALNPKYSEEGKNYISDGIKATSKMKYTNTEIENMYVDWFNNFLSCQAWRDYYNLGMAEGENILDLGRELNHKSSAEDC